MSQERWFDPDELREMSRPTMDRAIEALDRGDVMVFSHLTVHRTYQTADMTQPRISLEMRCGDGRSPRLRAARQDLLDVKVA